jgi:hypothetical protein
MYRTRILQQDLCTQNNNQQKFSPKCLTRRSLVAMSIASHLSRWEIRD